MQAGNLVLVQGTSFVEEAIQFVERGGFNHIALAISDSEVIEANPSGVSVNKLYYERYAVYEVLEMTAQQANVAIDYAKTMIGTPYNFLQDASYLAEYFGIEISSKFWSKHGKVICSSLVDLSLRKSGIVLREDREAGNVSPMGCIYTPKVRLIENHNLWEV